jgi:predicted RNase H-like nuclease
MVGFDSALTPQNRGSLIGMFRENDGTLREIERPRFANFAEASNAISEWQSKTSPGTTMVLIDQPTTANATGQRPVDRPKIMTVNDSRRARPVGAPLGSPSIVLES